MELRQIKGDTWCLEGAELIPLVRLPGDKCVLLDSGHAFEGPALTAALEGAGLTPLGVFCSHAHVDHAGNNSYLRKRYGARICLPLGEAALSASLTMYKAVYNAFTPRSLEARNGHLLGPVDETVGMDQLCLAYYRKKQLLTTHVEKAALYARNIDAMAEYLVDVGRMDIVIREGVRYFVRV